MKKVTFVCTGNTCRSPMAEGMFNHYASQMGCEDILRADSAGIGVIEGDIVSPKSVDVCLENGFDISGHAAKQIDEQLIRDSDLVLTMTMNHRDTLRRQFRQYADKIYMIGEYAGSVCCNGDIPDPFGMPLQTYRKTYQILDGYVRNLLKELKENEE